MLATSAGCGGETDVGTPCKAALACVNGVCGQATTPVFVDRQSQGCEDACMADDGASYCSCRCNGNKGDDGICVCPAGYECSQVTNDENPRNASWCKRMD